MGSYIRTRITTRVLRTIDKVGGLDEYLLGDKKGRIKELGVGGWKLRWRIMQTDKVKERFRREREMLGLPPKEDELVGSDGNTATRKQVVEEIATFDAQLKKGEEFEVGEDAELVEAEPGFMHEQQPGKQEKVVL